MKYAMAILIVLMHLSCGNDDRSRPTATESALATFKNQYHAIGSWREALDSAGVKWQRYLAVSDLPLSCQADDAIKWLNGRPVLFRITLDDITRDDSGYTMYFSDVFGWSTGDGSYHGLLSLRCSEEQMNRIAQLPLTPYSDLAVVASLSAFRRPRLSVVAESEGEGDDIEDHMWIVADNEISILFGKLLDMRELGLDSVDVDK